MYKQETEIWSPNQYQVYIHLLSWSFYTKINFTKHDTDRTMIIVHVGSSEGRKKQKSSA